MRRNTETKACRSASPFPLVDVIHLFVPATWDLPSFVVASPLPRYFAHLVHIEAICKLKAAENHLSNVTARLRDTCGSVIKHYTLSYSSDEL